MRKMKKMYFEVSLMLLSVILFCGFQKPAFMISNPPVTPEVGTLTAYYATKSFTAVNGPQFNKGELICDSNDPINRIVDMNAMFYKYEGDDTGEYYSYLLPKSEISKTVYKMNQLPVSLVENNAVFKSQQGLVAKIFKSDINGHKYYSWDKSGGEFKAVFNAEETLRHKEGLVLNVEYCAKWIEGKDTFTYQLNVKDGNVDLYRKNRYYFDEGPQYCRYREGLIGIIEEEWCNKDGWEGPTFSEDGKLLVDQYEVADIPQYWSIAYIADKDALYINGTLYYRQTN